MTYNLPDTIQNVAIQLIGFLIHTCNAASRQNIMELIKQYIFPTTVKFFHWIREFILRRNAPDFRLAQGQLTLSVAAFNRRLGRICSPMTLEIQFADITILRRSVLCAIFKKFLRAFHLHFRHALQILFA